jgi:uncharacterized cupredoxin-like copper-binding protein
VLRKLPVLIAVITALAFGLAACGDDESDTSTTAASSDTSTSTTEESTTEEDTTASGGGGGGETVDISETEFKIDPADPTVKAGSVTFAVSNDGSQVHNLEIEGNGVEEETEDLDGGQSAELTVDLEPGTYEMYCSIDGHRDLGMEGSITVQ